MIKQEMNPDNPAIRLAMEDPLWEEFQAAFFRLLDHKYEDYDPEKTVAQMSKDGKIVQLFAREYGLYDLSAEPKRNWRQRLFAKH